MSVLAYMEGLLEPVVLDTDFQATFQNLATALRTGSTFFMCKDETGELIGINIARVIYIKEIEA